MEKILGSLLVFLCIYGNGFLTVSASANSDYQVILPDTSTIRSNDISEYSQEIRTLNQVEIDKLPISEQQDAITKVLQVIANINKEEINEITNLKSDGVVEDTFIQQRAQESLPGGGLANDSANPSWVNYGDILVTFSVGNYCIGTKVNGKCVGYDWNHGHAGIADFTKGYTIDAMPDTGVARKYNYKSFWTDQCYTNELYVGGATQAKYKTAVNFSRKQLGKPYAIQTTLGNTNSYYCSKLVYKAWLEAGYNVGNSYTDSSWATGIIGVTPKQILWDDNVFLYKIL